jgi:hypothetical protein
MISFASAEDSQGKLFVQLEADVLGGTRPSKDLRLVVRNGDLVTAYRPVFGHTERVGGSRFIRRRQVMRWQVYFELPVSVEEDPSHSFQLLCEPHPVLDLPKLGWAVKPLIYERRTPRAGALLAASGALLAGLAPGFALAEGGGSGRSRSVTTSVSVSTQAAANSAQTTSATSTTGDAQAAQTTSGSASTTTETAPPDTTTTTAAPLPQAPSGTTTSTTTAATVTTTATTTTTGTNTLTTGTTTGPSTTATGPTTTGPTTTSTTPTPTTSTTPTTTKAPGGSKSKSKGSRTTASPHRRPGSGHHPAGSRAQRGKGTAPARGPVSHSAPAPASSVDSDGGSDDFTAAATTPVVTSGSAWTIPVLADPFTSVQLRRYTALVGGLTQPPKSLVGIYRAAAQHYHIPWQVLAAINYVETGYGRDLAVSSAGAIGWMQFMPSTWAQYGQAVNLQGRPAGGMPNPWDPTDAIFAAARYLVAAGAQRNLPGAVYAYNHAGWYVQEVLSIAEQIARQGLKAGSKAAHKISAMTTMAQLLNGLPYVWGGGHSTFSMISGGYDCSGFVSAVLHAAGYLAIPQSTQTLPGQPGIEPGPGRWVTILDRTDAGISTDHVIIDIDGQWWESGGWGVQSDRVHRMRDISAAYLQSFNVVLHPQGL